MTHETEKIGSLAVVAGSPPSAWVRVTAPGLDIQIELNDADSKEIIACALSIAERRTKLQDKPTPATADQLDHGAAPAGESRQPPAVSGEDSRHHSLENDKGLTRSPNTGEARASDQHPKT